jgi:DNA-binding transcriptional LysR family regulator
LRGLVDGHIALLTTPCVGDGFVPALLKVFTRQYPCVRVGLVERSWQEFDDQLAMPGLVPGLRPVHPKVAVPELRQKVLWRERMHLVAYPKHPWRPLTGWCRWAPLANEPLIVIRSSVGAESEVGLLLGRRGVVPRIDFTVDAPQTLVALAAAGLGWGYSLCSTNGTVVLDLEDLEVVREVTVFWHDVLPENQGGQALYDTVLASSTPAGTQPAKIKIPA